ncbi:CRISPR-associated endoribonuclease Cas6 [Eggerthellaceae bacterium zg-887]|uniref:CRISPR-associated endoribonuclease Cas6 n=1 Tax=Xiamenia xianingshaonis TaxID=2682776 RepID=UPI00140A806F|nr:CRISPR-associated endoribonuclease Cas6 [Xiamenia xianingshaonis]NHM16481.1 CRISPR-associated endoribonuclease Cas6 [Xiamenia xianingshaonis]
MDKLTTLTLELAPPDSFDVSPAKASSLGPFLQGCLMEHVDSGYAESVHGLPFNPYSQHCVLDEQSGRLLWCIKALNDGAARAVIDPLRSVDSVSLRGIGKTFQVSKTTSESISLASLVDLLSGESVHKQTVHFVTPTAFKRKGSYEFMPTPRLMLQNLFMHYNQVYGGSHEVDEDVISYIEQHVRISSYNLRSQYFSHAMGEGRKIPAFVGTLTLSMTGPDPLKNLVRMLCAFGEYAGVGIKTSMGMGALKCLKPNKPRQSRGSEAIS